VISYNVHQSPNSGIKELCGITKKVNRKAHKEEKRKGRKGF
jgi:hypothetical protein